MRVLEQESSFNMGKKKHKLLKSKENDATDSSEEVSGKGCLHVSKAVNFSTMKKGLVKQATGECSGCAKNKSEPKNLIETLDGASNGDMQEDVDPTIWLCLHCGHQGCSRTSPEKHAYKHFDTSRSPVHNVVVNMSNWVVWCYACDCEIPPEKYKKVAECVEYLKKATGVPVTPEPVQVKNGNPVCLVGVDTSTNKVRPLSGKGASSANAPCNKVKGLSNLGNTCFFNAVLQNLTQTFSLEYLLCERKKGNPLKLQGSNKFDQDSCSSSDEGDNDRNNKHIFKDLPSIEISISDPGPLTQSLVVFLHDINSTGKTACVNPSALFGQVCKKAPRFKGMQQQDSHELLRYLLDNMKTEEIKRVQAGILKHFKLAENTNPKKVDDDTKMKLKAYGHEIKHTFVECLFGGQLISTIVCEECKYISQILEPFLDLSLPVTEEKPQRPNQQHGTKKTILDVTEDMANAGDGGQVVKEKISKHQSKKQKKKIKRDIRRHKPKTAPTETEDKDDGDQVEKGDEQEEKDDENGDKEEEKYDDSDADVEDNLESDTSRCYTNGVNTMDNALNDTSENGVPDNNLSPRDTEASGYCLNNGTTCLINGSTCFEYESRVDSFPEKLLINNCEDSKTDCVTDICKCNRESHLNGKESTSLHVSCKVELNGSVNANQYVNRERHLDALTTVSLACNPVCEEDRVTKLDVRDKFRDRSINGYVCTETDINKNCTENQLQLHAVGDEISECNSHIPQENEHGLEDDIHGTIVSSEDQDTMDKVLENSCLAISTLSFEEKSSCMSSDISNLTLNDEILCGLQEHTETTHAVSTEGMPTDMESNVNECSLGQDLMQDDSTLQCKMVAGTHQISKHHNSWKDLKRDGQRKSINTLAERYHPKSGECSLESCLHQFTAAELLTGNNKFGCKNCTKLKYKNTHKDKDKELVYSNANKQFLIFQLPAVLTLHLKRFEQVGFSSRKVNIHVEFPFVLDIAPYCSSLTQGIKPGQKKVLYSLYGVVEHSGRLTSGHYTAYVKVRANIGTLNNFLNKHNVTLKEYLHTYAQNAMNEHDQDVVDNDAKVESVLPPGRWYHISDSRVNEVTEASVEKAQAYLLFYERIY